MIIGVTVGLITGYFRGRIDTLFSRAMDLFLAFPVLVLAVGLGVACADGCLGGVIQPGLPVVIFVITLTTWPYMARIVRGQVLSLREREFVEASRSLGASDTRIIFREILPNLVAPIIVYSTILIPQNILYEAALSFLGVGIDPSKPSWGAMISDATSVFQEAWWFMVLPGPRAPDHRPRFQPRRRRAAGRAQPADVQVGARASRAQPLRRSLRTVGGTTRKDRT